MQFKIKDFAKICGISPSTMRFYEKMGLRPSERTEKGYRVYTDSDVYRVNTLNSLAAQGFTVAESAAFAEGCDPQEYCRSLQKKTEGMEKELFLLEKKIAWNRMLYRVYTDFETLENMPFIAEIPDCCFFPCTLYTDPSPSLAIAEQLKQIVSMLPVSCYACLYIPSGSYQLGMIMDQETMQRYAVSQEHTIPVPSGRTLVMLVRDYNGEDLRHDKRTERWLKYMKEQPDVYVVHLMVETEEYGKWPQFLLIHLPDDITDSKEKADQLI